MDAATTAEVLTTLPLVTDLVELLGVVAPGDRQGEGATDDPAGPVTHPMTVAALRVPPSLR